MLPKALKHTQMGQSVIPLSHREDVSLKRRHLYHWPLYNIWRHSKLSTDLLSLELFLSIAKREGLYMSVLFLFVIQWALNKWFFSCGKECLSFCQLPKLNLLELKQESDVKMVVSVKRTIALRYIRCHHTWVTTDVTTFIVGYILW